MKDRVSWRFQAILKIEGYDLSGEEMWYLCNGATNEEFDKWIEAHGAKVVRYKED